MPDRPVKQAQRLADVCQDSLRRDNAKWLELIWCMLHEAPSAVPIFAGRMDQLLNDKTCWAHSVPGKQFIPVVLAVNLLCYRVSQLSAGQLRQVSLNIGPRQPAPLKAQLRTAETEQLCGDIDLPGDLAQSESTSTLHPGLSVCMLDPKSPLAAAGIFAAGVLVRTNQNCMHSPNSVATDTLNATYVKANWLT